MKSYWDNCPLVHHIFNRLSSSFTLGMSWFYSTPVLSSVALASTARLPYYPPHSFIYPSFQYCWVVKIEIAKPKTWHTQSRPQTLTQIPLFDVWSDMMPGAHPFFWSVFLVKLLETARAHHHRLVIVLLVIFYNSSPLMSSPTSPTVQSHPSVTWDVETSTTRRWPLFHHMCVFWSFFVLKRWWRW